MEQKSRNKKFWGVATVAALSLLAAIVSGVFYLHPVPDGRQTDLQSAGTGVRHGEKASPTVPVEERLSPAVRVFASVTETVSEVARRARLAEFPGAENLSSLDLLEITPYP